MGVPLARWPWVRFGGKFAAISSQDKTESSLQDEGIDFIMKMNLRRYIGVLAVAAGIGIGGAAVQLVAAPFQDQDYSKTKTYQQGMREGKDDQAHNLDHSKKRHFKKDADQKAYEAGYQKGHGG
jgi:hypothetical protein